MTNKNKKIGFVIFASVVTALSIAAVTFKPNLGFMGDAEGTKYQVQLGSSNGAAAVTSLKTNFVMAKTKLGNDVKMAYKNCEVTSNKVAKIKAKGFYGNAEPIYGANKITFVSDAAAGDAEVIYGKTSNCIDGKFDLAAGAPSGIAFNYFKIAAKNDVVVESINMEFNCDNSDVGYKALNSSSTHTPGAYSFNSKTDHYAVSRGSGYAAMAKVALPDYYDGADGYLPVTELETVSNSGTFEGGTALQEVYIPETYTKFGQYAFYSNTNIKEFTLPYALTEVKGFSVPKNQLEVLNIHCKNLATASTVVDMSNHSKLKTINISYDVEFLPNIISSFPSSVVINYEGTTAEWEALKNVAGTSSVWKNWSGDVVCSDTQKATVTFSYPNATLDSVATSKQVEVIVGKQIANPGKPVYNDNAMKFCCWKVGGEEAVFPYTVTGDVTFTAHFIDWPAGASIDNAAVLTDGVALDMSFDNDTPFFYSSFTATQACAVKFRVTEAAKTSGTSYLSLTYKMYDGSKQLLNHSYSHDDAYDVKPYAGLSSDDAWQVHFAAGETYYFAVALNANGNIEGSAKLTATVANADNQLDYTVAKAYTLGQTQEVALDVDFMKWYTFQVETSGDYWFENGRNSTGWSQATIGKFVDGVWTVVKDCGAAKNNVSSTTVALETGVTYYVCVEGNTASTKTYFLISSSLPAGASAGTAMALTVGAEEFEIPNVGVSYTYYYVELAEAKTLLIKMRCSSSYGTPEAKVYKASGDAQGDQVTLTSAGTNEKMFAAEAGKYFITLKPTGSYQYYAQVVEAPAGYNYINAVERTVTDATTSIAIPHTNANGTYYKFTAPNNKFAVMSMTGSSLPTVTLYNAAKTKVCALSSGSMIAKLTKDAVYYIEVKGALNDDYALAVEFEDSIENGYSEDTALILALDTPKTWTYVSGNSSVYAKFTASESGSHMIVRENNTYTMYVYDLTNESASVSVSSGPTTYQKSVMLEAGHTYKIYYTAYSTHTITVKKNAPGFEKAAAIEKTVVSTDTSMTLKATLGTDGTWYKFTADYAGWYEISTEATGATLTVYKNTATSSACEVTSSKVGQVKTAVNDVIYMKLVAAADADVVFAIAHPAGVKDGKSVDTPFDFVLDADQEYMTIAEAEHNREHVFYKISGLTEGTRYCFSSNSGVDIDVTNIYDSTGTSFSTSDYTKKIDAGGDAATYRCGGSSDFYILFNAPADGIVILDVWYYAISTYEVQLNLFTVA